MHTNGLNSRGIGMPGPEFRRNIANLAEPTMVGAGMVLEARGNVYAGTVPAATVAARRARNRRARAARRINRKK